jgi:uncharacterized membrane protein
MNQNTFSIKQVISESWSIFSKNYGKFYKFAIVTWLLMILVQIATSLLTLTDFFLLTMVSSLTIFVFNAFITIGFTQAVIKIVRGEPVELKILFSGQNLIIKYLLSTLAMGLIVFLGFLLLLIPGIYLAFKYMFLPLVVVDKKELSFSEIFKTSSELTKGIKMKLFAYIIAIQLVNLIGLIPLGLGLLITIPMSYISFILVYERLIGNSSNTYNVVAPENYNYDSQNSLSSDIQTM